MKFILITLVCLFSLQLSAQKGSFYLTNVNIHEKKMSDYHYKDGKDSYVATFKSDGKNTSLEITKNKTHYFSITRDRSGKPVYRLGKSEELIGFNKKSYQILPQEIKYFLAYLEADEREYQPQFNGGGHDNLNDNGIPNMLGEGIDAAADSGDGDCSQTAPCSCENGQTRNVTCNCKSAITCELRTAEICSYDEYSQRMVCKMQKSCVGRCSPTVD